MPALPLLLAQPLSDADAERLDWKDTLTLPAAPKPVPPKRITLMDVLAMDDADELFKEEFGIRVSEVCKAFRVFLRNKRGFFYLEVDLIDTAGCLSWTLFQGARRMLETHDGLHVTKFHAMHTEVADDIKIPRGKRKNDKLDLMYKWMHDLVEANRLYLKELGYAFRTNTYLAYNCLHANNGRLRGPFPVLEKFWVNNSFYFTGVTVELLFGMPRLTHVGVLGGLDMTDFDEIYRGDKRPAVLQSVAAALPPSLKVLDLDTYQPTGRFPRILFVTAFAEAAERGHFGHLETVSMRLTYATMRKTEGIPFMQALQHCAALRIVFLGESARFKSWHFKAIDDLALARPGILSILIS